MENLIAQPHYHNKLESSWHLLKSFKEAADSGIVDKLLIWTVYVGPVYI